MLWIILGWPHRPCPLSKKSLPRYCFCFPQTAASSQISCARLTHPSFLFFLPFFVAILPRWHFCYGARCECKAPFFLYNIILHRQVKISLCIFSVQCWMCLIFVVYICVCVCVCVFLRLTHSPEKRNIKSDTHGKRIMSEVLCTFHTLQPNEMN